MDFKKVYNTYINRHVTKYYPRIGWNLKPSYCGGAKGLAIFLISPCWSLVSAKTTQPEILPLTTQKSSPSQPRNPPPHNPPFIQLLPILPLTTQKSSPSKPSLHQTSSKQYTQVLTWHIPGLTLNGSSLTWHVHSFTWHSPSFNWQVFSLAQHFLTLT